MAKGQSSAQRRLPAAGSNKLPLSWSAARQAHRKRVNEKMKKWFKSSPRCQRLWGIDPTMPLPRFRKDTRGLECWKVSLLIQMRSGHVPLQAHLYRIGKVPSPVCPMCHKADKTVSHYLIICMAFATQRGCMERDLRRAAKLVSMLLMNPKAFQSLFKYIHETRR